MSPAEQVAKPEHPSIQRTCERLFSQWARAFGSRLPTGPSLLMYHPSVCPPRIQWLESGSNVALRLASGTPEANLEWGERRVVRSNSRSLPLQTGSIAIVAMCHLVAVGKEPELAEACRLLQPGGRLFILGLNRLGLKHLAGGRKQMPAIHPLALRARLDALDMNVLGLYAAGFLTQEWPIRMDKGAGRVLVPLADHFLVVAKPVEPRILNPLAKSRLRAVGVPSALVGR